VDLTDGSALEKVVTDLAPSSVVHLAAVSFVATNNVQSMYATNVTGSLNLLESLAKLPQVPERVILASSAQVYGDAGDQAVEETALPAPVNHYGASKLAMEAIAHAYGERMPSIITRPFNYTGPGQASHFLVPKIVNHFARRADRIELGNLNVERDFLDVNSVVAIYADLLDLPEADGQILNVCSGQGVTLQGIIDRLERLTEHRMDIVVNPDYVRSNEIRKLVGSNARLSGLVRNTPDFDFDETLRNMLDVAEQRLAR
jgi:nucleoside-diphosphate-sugar epimerase